MSRRHRAEKREIIPDPKFGDLVVTKFMNAIMYDGKKSVAEKIVYDAFDTIEAKAKQSPISVFQQALSNVAPAIEVPPAVLAVRPIRFPSKFAPSAVRLSPSVGFSPLRAAATRRPWKRSCRAN